MAKNSAIEWTDATWNPWRGCRKVSAGCKNCYAERRAKWIGEDFNTVIRTKTTLRDPLKWKEAKSIFVCSLSDFFHEDVDPEWRREAWEIMGHAKQHTFLLLTKRPQNIPDMLPVGWIEGMWKHQRNVWLGVSAENQAMADLRIPRLLDIPAQVHFVSAEPLLSNIDFSPWLAKISWLITGGESGLSARPMNLEWVRQIRDHCQQYGVAYFHKQNGGSKKIDGAWGGNELDGKIYQEVPDA